MDYRVHIQKKGHQHVLHISLPCYNLLNTVMLTAAGHIKFSSLVESQIFCFAHFIVMIGFSTSVALIILCCIPVGWVVDVGQKTIKL